MPTKQTIAEPPVKHTPHGLGTLTVDADFRKDAELGQYLGRLDILDAKGQRVGSVTLRPHRTDAQHLAAANLFAGAPVMLAKLQEIHCGMACSCKLQHFVDGPVPCPTCQIGAVVALAEGRAQ